VGRGWSREDDLPALSYTNNVTPPDLFYEKRYSHTEMTNPDFVALAKAMNVHAIRCDSLTDLPAKMKEFMDYDNNKPVLLEARVSKGESRNSLRVRFLGLFRSFRPPQASDYVLTLSIRPGDG
jgi:hypothetical protein